MSRTIIMIAGPTAVGKTEYAIETAKAFDGEIVSCDSMQLYKYMDIGSAKPTPKQLSHVKHYMVDLIDPAEDFSVAAYQRMAKEAIEEIFAKGKTPVISGGTGLYMNSLIYDMDFGGAGKDSLLRDKLYNEGRLYGAKYLYQKLSEIDSEAAARIHPNNEKKIVRAIEAAVNGRKIPEFGSCKEKCREYEINLIILTRNRDELYDRINKRVDNLVHAGLFEEVESLLKSGLTKDNISMKGIGYKEIIEYFEGNRTREEAIELIKKNTRHYAKRQLTWFRRYEDAHRINISDYDSEEAALEDMLAWLKKTYEYTIKATNPTT